MGQKPISALVEISKQELRTLIEEHRRHADELEAFANDPEIAQIDPDQEFRKFAAMRYARVKKLEAIDETLDISRNVLTEDSDRPHSLKSFSDGEVIVLEVALSNDDHHWQGDTFEGVRLALLDEFAQEVEERKLIPED